MPAGFAPETGDQGLTDRGREYVRRLNDARVFVDLAHVSREGFFDAVAVHDRSQPLIVTHTGVAGVHPHWRNLDDEQLRAIADTGGARHYGRFGGHTAAVDQIARKVAGGKKDVQFVYEAGPCEF